MPTSIRSSRLVLLVGLLLAAVPVRAAAQPDCRPPTLPEPDASQEICNIDPDATLTPQSLRVTQPVVPVFIHAFDHESGNWFESFKILVDDTIVTSSWPVTVMPGGWGTGKHRTFTSSGHITLTEERPVRTVGVELCDTQFCKSESSTFTLRRPGVEVGPDGGTASVVAATTQTTTFTVKNTGTAEATFALGVSCRNAADGQSIVPCTPSTGSVTLLRDSTKTVTVTYPASAPGTMVNVLLRAAQMDEPAVHDAGWTDVVVRGATGSATAPPLVSLVRLNAGSMIERSQCVTVAAGGGAYECGDLRLAHGLPAHRTHGRTWAPVLLYNSQHARPRPTVYADVTVPVGNNVPTRVDVTVNVNGTVHQAQFVGDSFPPGVTKRVGVQWDASSMPTGLYPYTLQATSHYSSGPATSSGRTDTLAVVNWSTVYFGSGWWLAGLERLHMSGARMLWVGGDGSTRVYEPISASSWIAKHPDGAPDTLVFVNSEYVRKLPGGGAVYFKSTGLHDRTVNRLGQTTRFVHGTLGLESIHAPPGVPGSSSRSWTLNWDYVAQQVRSITATAPGAPSRTTKLTKDAQGRITAIIDPDSTLSVGFDYSGTTKLVTRRRDRRGTYTHYTYDAAQKLTSARVQMGPSVNDAADVVGRFEATESKGVALSGATASTAAVNVSQAYTRLDGPRTDKPDVTYLWLSNAGSVRRVRDPLGAETFVQHDARFPALATKVTAPTGQVSRAHYDARGRVDTATVENVLGDGRSLVTTYRYDDRWDRPDTVLAWSVQGSTWTPLAGGKSYMAYDAVTGNVLWQRQGDDFGRQVDFAYDTASASRGQLIAVRSPSGVPGQVARDSLVYDGRGNLRMRFSPLNYISLVYRDSLGRDTLTITPTRADSATTSARVRLTGVWQRTSYDVMDRVTQSVTIGPRMQQNDVPIGGIIPHVTASDTLYVQTFYDNEGLPLEVRRWAAPDSAELHVLSTSYTYDAAGRKKSEVDGVNQQHYVYDQAGNAVAWITARGHTITSEYDVMGRMVGRVVPEVSYPWHCPSQDRPCQNPYPMHPNGPSSSLVIPEEWTFFRYDTRGNMVYAENADAIVTRSYYPNGAIKTDALAIRSLEGLDFTTHRYELTYGYNLSGQVTSMRHPTNLAASGQDWDAYMYDPVTSTLSAMTDRRGNYFEFYHNYAGQMTSLRGPSYSDSMRYDREGRMVRRVETAAIAGVLHDDSLTYDARGKLLRVDVGTAGLRQRSTYTQWYSGIGNLVATDWQNETDNGRTQEVYGTDALGNTVWRRSGDGGSNPQRVRFDHEYDPGLGRLRSIESVNEGTLSWDFYPEQTSRTYDHAGNLDWAILSQMGVIGVGDLDFVRDKRSRSYYGADERLRYFQERDLRRAPGLGAGTPELEGVWEEYRYDPLGRRVLVNTRTKDLCTTNAFRCSSATTRMVWAGDQLIWEIRGVSQSPGEQSLGLFDAYGTVSYTHAGGIDRPLVITKGSTSILPHQNWRGQFSSGTYTSGARSDCLNGATTNCHPVAWPGWRTTAWHTASKEQDIRTWWGGLVDGMRDASGQMYMRNRYYDPATGQFTQPDPIGIAGGLNSYGYAAGDPVSRSDPFGLCPPCRGNENTQAAVEREVAMVESRTGRDALLEGATVAFGVGVAVGIMAAATEAVIAAAPTLADRARAIHGVLSTATQRRTTTAVARVVTESGRTETWVASSERVLRPAQRAALRSGERAIAGTGHAEATLINAARAENATVQIVAASRPICASCARAIDGVRALFGSVLKN